eukprot:1182919-Prorocentrum_minimum.AAC.1
MSATLPDAGAAKRMFRAVDTDGDGTLSKKEVSAVLDGLKAERVPVGKGLLRQSAPAPDVSCFNFATGLRTHRYPTVQPMWTNSLRTLTLQGMVRSRTMNSSPSTRTTLRYTIGGPLRGVPVREVVCSPNFSRGLESAYYKYKIFMCKAEMSFQRGFNSIIINHIHSCIQSAVPSTDSEVEGQYTAY